MSRIGKLPVNVPAGTTVTVSDDALVTVKGPKGELSQKVSDRITIEVNSDCLVITRKNDERESRAQHGLYRALIYNMVVGVTEGFTRELTIVGTGYRAQLKGQSLELMLGYSHPVQVAPPAGITFEVPQPTSILVKGADKQVVGQIAAEIRKLRAPEPYLGKGIRYSNENVRRKEGKAAK